MDILLTSKVYVNKIIPLMPLIIEPGCVALTAPRRMGKSMTLSTLHLIKLLGTQDFILLMDKKTDKIPGWDFTKKRLLE